MYIYTLHLYMWNIQVFVLMLLFLVGGLVAGANQEALKKSLEISMNETDTVGGVPIFTSGDASNGFFSGILGEICISFCLFFLPREPYFYSPRFQPPFLGTHTYTRGRTCARNIRVQY